VSLRHYLQLSLTSGLGPTLIGRLVAAAGSAEAACCASIPLLQHVEGIGQAKAHKIAHALHAAAPQVQEALSKAAAFGATLLCLDDPDYPLLLKQIPDPPPVLYAWGNLQPRDLNAVALVGSRRASHYGREQAGRFAALLGGAGVTVISGGARGVDSAAHRGALSHPLGRTIAVLGSGLDVPYPPENEPLFRQVAQRGAVISEMPFGTSPNRENFPRRNRIISGLSRGVLVVEADTRSGALITARQAADDHNRPVMALPGRVDNPLSAGPHQLIRDGAALVANLEDILTSLGPLPEGAAEALEITSQDSDNGMRETEMAQPRLPRADVSLSDRQKLILRQFDGEPLSTDGLIDRTGLPAGEILQELTFLSLKGLLKHVGGQTYTRSASQ
jgi:DNA processing protein